MSRARRVRLASAGAIVLVLLVGAVWLVVTALLARRELGAVRHELPALRRALSSGDYVRAGTIAHSLEGHARRAHELTSGPAWASAAALPWAGQPAETVRVLSTQSDRLGAKVLPGVLDMANQLSADTLRHGTDIDLTKLVRAAPVLDHAASAATTAAAAIIRTPTHTWLGTVDSARSTVLSQLGTVANQLDGASRAVHTLLPMLGATGTQRYFIGFLNESQARGVGGLPGAFAIVTADHGRLTFTHFQNDNTLFRLSVHVDLGAEFHAHYGFANPTGIYGDSDYSPHFPYAAQIWAAMWEKKSGEHVTGAVALDPTALSYLLAVTGPATLPSGERVTAANVVSLTEKIQYSRYANDEAGRKKFLVELAASVSHRVISGHGDTKHLLRAAVLAASQRRILVWSADPVVEANIVRFGYAGVVQATGSPFTGFVVDNDSGSKLDYYLGRSMTYSRTGCGAGSTARATFVITNGAPAKGLPKHVTVRRHNPPPGMKPGDNRLLITYYGSAGAKIRSVTIDGRRVAFTSAPENGLVTITVAAELKVGQSRTITVTLGEPPANRPVQVLNQPLVRGMKTRVTGDVCG